MQNAQETPTACMKRSWSVISGEYTLRILSCIQEISFIWTHKTTQGRSPPETNFKHSHQQTPHDPLISAGVMKTLNCVAYQQRRTTRVLWGYYYAWSALKRQKYITLNVNTKIATPSSWNHFQRQLKVGMSRLTKLSFESIFFSRFNTENSWNYSDIWLISFNRDILKCIDLYI